MRPVFVAAWVVEAFDLVETITLAISYSQTQVALRSGETNLHGLLRYSRH